jgi:hypothetical protein
MSKTGFIIHKGIQQIFTTGPFQGSTVVNGYSINGVLQGPTVNHNQSFVEDLIENIYIEVTNTTFSRKFEDQTQCATDCNAPVLSSVVSNCSTNTFTLVNSNVNTSISPSTIIEVSLSPTGFPVTQRYTRNNTNGNNTYNIDITSLGIIPGTTIYFRLINLCNNGTIESFPSNIISTICASEPPPPPPKTTVRLNWDFLTAGGYSPGSFQLNVNGIGNISVNSSDSGFIEVPSNSLIEVYVNAPLADTSSGNTPIFVSQVFATTSQGGASSNVGTTFAEISFTITEETYVKGIAQVGNDRTPSFV